MLKIIRPSEDEKSRLHDFLRVIRPISRGIQFSGILLWFAAWWLADASYRYSTSYMLLLPCAAVLCICAGAYWGALFSVFSIFAIWLISLAFSILVAASLDSSFWAMTVSAIVSLVVSPLFGLLRHYVTTIFGAWLIFSRGGLIDSPHSMDTAWAWLVLGSVIALGTVMNVVFTRLHRDSLHARKELEKLAYKDVLTGIANRRKLLADVQKLHEQGMLAEGCFLMLDVDNFKSFNDDFGHADGDLVLQEIAKKLKAVARNNLFGRLGGEEFGIMLTGGGVDGAQTVATSILEQVRAVTVKGRPVTVSIGISGLGRGRAPSGLIREADVALYEAKRKGKDRFVHFHDALDAGAVPLG